MLKLAALVAVALTACGPFVSETQINPIPRALTARSPQQVELISSGAPTRPHVDVALLAVRGGLSWQDRIDSLRATAAADGCDALVLNNAAATCVVYTDVAVAPAAPVAAPPEPAAPAAQ